VCVNVFACVFLHLFLLSPPTVLLLGHLFALL
jgi:hypothetical protein